MDRFRRRTLWLVVWLAMTGIWLPPGSEARAAADPPQTGLHFAPNGNFDATGRYVPASAGFNLADVSSPAQLGSLPPGVKGLVWVGQCHGADAAFAATIEPYARAGNLFGFYLMDDPDPRGAPPPCGAAQLGAEVDWIHANISGATTFIVLMNLGTPEAPTYEDSYNPANSHVDLFGVSPYPCQSAFGGCRPELIDRYVAAAETSGIPRARIVPVYQAFGGGGWQIGQDGNRYLTPSPAQLGAMLVRWGTLVPAPAFDYAYSWGVQRNDQALAALPELRQVFAAHNRD